MHSTLPIGILLVALCAFLLIRVVRQCRRIARDERLGEEILRSVAAYVLLIDSDLNVLKTNYYALTGTERAARPPKVGNLLRCRNGEDAGVCGGHDLCPECPVRRAIAEAFREQRGFKELEAPMTLYDTPRSHRCTHCDVSVSGSYMTLSGSPRMVLTVSDITAQKQARRELSEARLRAEESDRMKTQFLANTSHELRTPLNAIIGFSELLLTDPGPEEKEEYMRIIRSNSEVLMQLVNDILDLSKIESGTLDYEYADVELDAVMEELEGGFRLRLPADGRVELRFRRPSTAPRMLRTDRRRLVQVIANLLSNAVKYTPEGSIEFGYEARDKELRFYVADTGIGIPAEHRMEVFRRFAKAGSHKQGIGIGLAISKSIVESMGGRIGVSSEVGKGSTFWFTLPSEPKPAGGIS